MKEKAFNKKKGVILMVGAFFMLLSSFFYIVGKSDSASYEDIQILGFIAIAQFIYTLYSWYYVRGSIFDAYMIFTIVLYAFNLAQPMLESTGLALDYRRLWGGGYGTSNELYLKATYYSLVFVLSFHLGAVLILKKDRSIAGNSTSPNFNIETKALMKSALFFSIISAPFYLYNLVQEFLIVRVFGYSGLYTMESSSRTIQIIGDLFTPAMMALFCTSLLRNQHVKQIALLVALLLFLPPLYLGGRTNAMIVLALLFIVYSSIKTINLKKLVVIGFIGIGMLFLMNLIAMARVSDDRSIEALNNVVGEENNNPVIATIEEMGWSLYPLALSMEAIPSSKDYSYGASFFWAVVSVIPNLGFWVGEHPGKKNDPAEWLNNYSTEDYGIGYSMCAGSYNEFGFLGLLLMFIYGTIFCKIFSYVSPQNIKRNPIQYVFALLFLWFAIVFVRNSLNGISRGLLFDVLPIYLLTMFFLQGKKRRDLGNKVI